MAKVIYIVDLSQEINVTIQAVFERLVELLDQRLDLLLLLPRASCLIVHVDHLVCVVEMDQQRQ